MKYTPKLKLSVPVAVAKMSREVITVSFIDYKLSQTVACSFEGLLAFSICEKKNIYKRLILKSFQNIY